METTEKYDSAYETNRHMDRVEHLLDSISQRLSERALTHDLSKLAETEKPLFDEWTPKLKDVTYGSDEYQGCLDALKPALDHHYAKNRHHPEFHENGFADMTLIDITEMLCDWKAATERHDDGDLRKSIDINQKRFGYSDEMKNMFLNTAEALKWIKPEERTITVVTDITEGATICNKDALAKVDLAPEKD